MLPLYVHIKTARDALSAERVYDVHCTTYGSRPSALVTWWLGTTQLLDHSSQVQYHFVQLCKQCFDKFLPLKILLMMILKRCQDGN